MHLAFKLDRRIIVTLGIGFVFGVTAAWMSKPIYQTVLAAYWQSDFAELTFRCDQSMRIHLIAKQKIAEDPNPLNVEELNAAEIGLLDCQSYDLMQKKMKRWGLTDNEIGEMVLYAAENNGKSIRKVIQIHEINY